MPQELADLPKTVGEYLMWVGAVGITPVSVLAVLYRYLLGCARDFSPGTGVAAGYFQNFLGPVLRAARSNGGPRVLLWMAGSDRGQQGNASAAFDSCVTQAAKRGTATFVNKPVATDKGTRTLLHMNSGAEVLGVDFPRTLSSIPESLAETKSGRLFSRLESLEARELRNFWLTLRSLIERENLQLLVAAFDCQLEQAHEPSQQVPFERWKELIDKKFPPPPIYLRFAGV